MTIVLGCLKFAHYRYVQREKESAGVELATCHSGLHNREFAAGSQLPVAHWHEHIGNPTIADAVLDRLVHTAHRIDLRGESLRKLRAAKAARLDETAGS